MFSRRLPGDTATNALTRRLEEMRARGISYVDLTESNPTRAGVHYPADLLTPLADAGGLRYEPQAMGIAAAREAVAEDCRRRGAVVNADQIVLTASTSEAYSWIFKLLCDPGDRVVVPRPSYPLFEHLTRLEAVTLAHYDLDYHRRWEIDFDSVERALTPEARALLVVAPNNPTGSYLTSSESARLQRLCSERGVALVVDEVFADYRLDKPADAVCDIAAGAEVLAFTLGGLSKTVGLPQLKLGWMVVGGPAAVRAAALEGLELIADSYLSVSTPVQASARTLLTRGSAIRDDIRARVIANLGCLRNEATRYPACEVLTAEGGWYAVVRVPATRSEETLVLDLLDRERVLVHPGFFFDFPREAYVIVSLLPAPDVFVDAVRRVLRESSR
jgi:aspartate/methionine/tyrosine aminotransferase